MTTKPTDSAERLKALMRQHTATAVATSPTNTPALPPPSLPVVAFALPSTSRQQVVPQARNVSWNRITIRLTAGELEKINNVVIATQQANRSSKVTATDVLRVALRRVKDQEAIDAREIKELRAGDGRFAKR